MFEQNEKHENKDGKMVYTVSSRPTKAGTVTTLILCVAVMFVAGCGIISLLWEDWIFVIKVLMATGFFILATLGLKFFYNEIEIRED